MLDYTNCITAVEAKIGEAMQGAVTCRPRQ